MDNKSKKSLLVIIILFIFTIGQMLYWSILGGQGTLVTAIVPLTSLPTGQHILLLLIWALIGSIIMVIIVPLVVLPIFLLFKKLVWNRYSDGYIELEEGINLKKFVKRCIFIFLLTMGLCATISPFINLNEFLSKQHRAHWVGDLGYQLIYIPHVFVGLALILYPIVIGLWSVGWALEDTGLMHYKLPDEGKKILYEIEPIHLKYNGLLKGYAGISAILYYFGLIMFQLSLGSSEATESSMLAVTITFLFVPAYLIYLKVWLPQLKKIFRKGKEPIPIITKRDLEEKMQG